MKIALLSVIVIVGLAILAGLGWLAFGHMNVSQKDFEHEYTPQAATTAAVPAAAATPTAPVAQQPALIMPEVPADTAAAPTATTEAPAATAEVPAAAPAESSGDTIPMPAPVPETAGTPAPASSAPAE